MTLDQLRIFVAVAERQHVTRAAETLNIAQSAVSAAIAALESRHDARLFERVGRGIRLSEAGNMFLDEARAVLARAESAEMMLAEIAGLKRGQLLIQSSETIASYWLPSRLVAYRTRHPDIMVKVSIGNSSEAVAAVVGGLAELGFVEGDVENANLDILDLAQDKMVIVVGVDHPWAKRDRLDLDELQTGEWVLREPGSGTRSIFESDLKAIGLDPADLKIALELPRNEAVISAVQAGLGATAVSANAAVAGLEAGLLAQVPLDLPVRTFRAIRHANRRPSHACEALLAAFRALGPVRCQPAKPPPSR